MLRKSHEDLAVRFVTADICPEKAINPPMPGSTVCHCRHSLRKSHQGPAVRFVAADIRPEKATKTRQHDLLRPAFAQKEPIRAGNTICYGLHWLGRATKTPQYDLLRPKMLRQKAPRPGSTSIAADICAERATKTRQNDLLRRAFAQTDS